MTIIRNDRELLDALGVRSREEARKAIYRGTTCGAWIAFTDTSVRVGSIIEGSDAEVTSCPLRYPFTMDDFWMALDVVQDEARLLWDEANTDDE